MKQKQANFGKAVRRRYLPGIDQLAEQIASDLKINLEILILQKLGLTFWLKNLPHFLLALSLVTGIAGTALNLLKTYSGDSNQWRTDTR